jgi:hypothetical protein
MTPAAINPRPRLWPTWTMLPALLPPLSDDELPLPPKDEKPLLLVLLPEEVEVDEEEDELALVGSAAPQVN